MTEQSKRPSRRFQFTLRKMLLWTAMMALWFGLLSSLGILPGVILIATILTSWVVVVAIVRVAFGENSAALVALLPAACIPIIECWDPSIPVSFVLLHVVVLGVMGSVIFVLVKVAFRVVSVLDHLMESKKRESKKDERNSS